MTDYPAQADATTAADSTEVQPAEAHPVDGDAHVDAHVDAQSDAHRDAHVGNGVYQSAGERISGATQVAVTRIRNNASLPASRGTTTIANEVVEKIAGIAARDVPGVYDVGGDTVRLLSSVREKLHLGEESKAQGIAVRLNGKEADLSITIVLEYGFVVSSVTDAVREKTISAVETLLGLNVTNVDILVDDIHVDHEGPVGDDASRAAGYSSGTQAITVGG